MMPADGIAYTAPDRVVAVDVKPLWWAAAGLQQTASGYGSKLVTRYRVRYIGDDGRPRWYRVYACIWSNVGTTYIIVSGRRTALDIDTRHRLERTS